MQSQGRTKIKWYKLKSIPTLKSLYGFIYLHFIPIVALRKETHLVFLLRWRTFSCYCPILRRLLSPIWCKYVLILNPESASRSRDMRRRNGKFSNRDLNLLGLLSLPTYSASHFISPQDRCPEFGKFPGPDLRAIVTKTYLANISLAMKLEVPIEKRCEEGAVLNIFNKCT